MGGWLKREVGAGVGVGVGAGAGLVVEISTGFDLEAPSVPSASAFSILDICPLKVAFSFFKESYSLAASSFFFFRLLFSDERSAAFLVNSSYIACLRRIVCLADSLFANTRQSLRSSFSSSVKFCLDLLLATGG
uniref:Putative ovule protein n=1 Tax=Solanum chacoense TaxID=4108 RepID=A0A0V0HH38_SOLCH